jgi:hypothetical protein
MFLTPFFSSFQLGDEFLHPRRFRRRQVGWLDCQVDVIGVARDGVEATSVPRRREGKRIQEDVQRHRNRAQTQKKTAPAMETKTMS